MKTMKFSVIFLLVAALNCFAQEPLSEQLVSDFSRRIQGYITSKDADGLASAFAQNAEITLEMPANAGGTTLFDKEQFIKSLRQGWSSSANYSYQVHDTTIRLSDAGTGAALHFVTDEIAELNGVPIRSLTSFETMEILKSEEGLKIQSYYSKISYTYSEKLRADLEQGIAIECIRDTQIDGKSEDEAERFCPCMARIIVQAMSKEDVVAARGGDQAIFNSIIFENFDEIERCEAL